MKASSSFGLIALACIAAFLLGSWTSGGNPDARSRSPNINTRSTSSREMAGATAAARPNLLAKSKSDRRPLSAETAARLTPEKRIALLKNAAVLADTDRQSAILCGLISAMTQEELTEATGVLLETQYRGNAWSPAVWNSLWTQWGRVNPEACLALSKEQSGNRTFNGFKGLNTPEDYRWLMVGWLETNPQAAMAWARQSKDNLREASGAAFAITSSANGDLMEMESAILSTAADKFTTQACFQEYFDLAASSGAREMPSEVYDRLAPSQREAVWPVVIERLAYTDPQMAAKWLENHAGDPGRDYRKTFGLINSLARQDPARTAAWAATLPVSKDGGPQAVLVHPATIAVSQWKQHDPDAVQAWLQTQPADTPWVKMELHRPTAPKSGGGE